MSLNTKVTLVMTLTFALLVAFSNSVLTSIVGPSFEKLEAKVALGNLGRVEQSIERELQFINQIAHDWASWDDIYTFVLDRNDRFKQKNLVYSSFSTLGINAILIFDVDGSVVWGSIFDLETGQKIGMDILDPGDLAPDSRLVHRESEHDKVDGLLMTRRGPLMLASLPILTNEGGGPVAGTLVVGRFFRAKSVAELEQQASVRFDAFLRNAEKQNLPYTIAENLNLVGGEQISLENENNVAAYSNIRDINNSRTLLLRVGTRKNISKLGSQTIWLASILIGLSCSVSLAVMSLFLIRYVLRPVSQLTKQVVSVGEGGSLPDGFAVGGRDEIGALSREFSSMIEKLRTVRQELFEQSYKAGMAETASGTLHNIRNALNPVVSRVSQIQTQVEQSSTENLAKAIEETNNPTTPKSRRDKLKRFVELASQGLLDRDNQIAGNLNDTLKQVLEIEEILNWQNRFARAELTIESVNLCEVIETALTLIPRQTGDRVEFCIDSSIKDAKAVRAQRISLIQVIQNILINAAEACGGRKERIIFVCAQSVTDSKHDAAVKVSISDNGIGIKRSDLDNVFKRNYTTKPGKRGGLGLHWCANALDVMDGKVHVESDGPDCGTTVHIILRAE